jgi:PAS domain S-box-containing protein
MKAKSAQSVGTDSMVLAVIMVAIIYWVLDSILNIFFSNKFNLIAELIGPDLYDIYIRVIVLCLLVILGSHAQSIINRLREATTRLNESEELWRSLVETAPDLITTVDPKGIIRFANQKIGGLPPEKAAGRCLYDFLPPDYRQMARESVESVFATGETDMFELRTGDNLNPTWFTYRVGPLRLNGRVIAATIISTDTTEFKKAEELMRYKELFDNVAEGVFIINRNGRLIEANDRVLESTRFSKQEIIKLSVAQIVEPDQIDDLRTWLVEVSRNREARFEVNLRTKQGDFVPNEINCRLVSYMGAPCFLCVARDISDTKMLQHQLIRSERLAATGQLAASIAHEINSPLQGITALLNVLRTTYEGDSYLLKKLDLIKSAFGSIRDTVKNLIDLNRPGKNKKQPVDINQVLEHTVALVRSHLKKNLIKVRLDLSAEQSALTASPQQIGQVFMNLINNAVESITHAPQYFQKAHHSQGAVGEINISTRNESDELVIEIADNGPGIAPEDLDRIFDPFFTRKKPMGMGVGLSICHGIVEDHKGRISAANRSDAGVAFTIYLPFDTSAAARSASSQGAREGQPA